MLYIVMEYATKGEMFGKFKNLECRSKQVVVEVVNSKIQFIILIYFSVSF